jgi:ureidoacrylate peracid hydrolase
VNGGGDNISGKPELAGQTVVVIGGTSGIGLETARRVRAEGPDVKDATADYSDREMHAALDLNIPNYASAIVATNEVVEGLSRLG